MIKTVVVYLNVRRVREWDSLDEAFAAVSRFQLSCHNLGIEYTAEVWQGATLVDSVQQLNVPAKILIALSGNESA